MARDRDRSEASDEQGHGKRHAQDTSTQCCWTTHGHQCELFGGMSPDIGDNARRYCQWHYINRDNPLASGNEREFLRWFTLWKGGEYPGVFWQHDPADIWDAIRGMAMLPAEPRVRSAEVVPF